MNSLSILSTFVKQRTYLITFVEQTAYLITLPDCSPAPETFQKTKRNLFCATPLRSRGLIRLVRSIRTFLHAARPTGPMSRLSILIPRSSTKTALNLAAGRSGRHKQGLAGGVVELDGLGESPVLLVDHRGGLTRRKRLKAVRRHLPQRVHGTATALIHSDKKASRRDVYPVRCGSVEVPYPSFLAPKNKLAMDEGFLRRNSFTHWTCIIPGVIM
jgi:hypothetical protein